MKNLTLVLFLAFFIVGCDSSKNNSLEFYKGNKDARIQKLKECNQSPADSEACRNASKAQHQITFSSNG